MTSYEQGDVVLATLPFSDLSGIKKRPAIVVGVPHPSVDLLLLPLTSQTQNLQLLGLSSRGGAGERNRTSNQRFTKPLLCH